LEGCRAIKVAGDARKSGEPDIDACYKGHALKLEVKRPGGLGPTPLQIGVMGEWRKAGALAQVARSVQDVQEIIASLDVGGR
jgi:hypothetical protein